jgi:hypothetical protein
MPGAAELSERQQMGELMEPRNRPLRHRRKLEFVLLYFTMAILLPVSNFSPSLLWPFMGLSVFTIIVCARHKFSRGVPASSLWQVAARLVGDDRIEIGVLDPGPAQAGDDGSAPYSRRDGGSRAVAVSLRSRRTANERTSCQPGRWRVLGTLVLTANNGQLHMTWESVVGGSEPHSRLGRKRRSGTSGEPVEPPCRNACWALHQRKAELRH